MKWQGLYRVGPDKVMIGRLESEHCMLIDQDQYRQWTLSPPVEDLDTIVPGAAQIQAARQAAPAQGAPRDGD
jgi:hypothetical protein